MSALAAQIYSCSANYFSSSSPSFPIRYLTCQFCSVNPFWEPKPVKLGTETVLRTKPTIPLDKAQHVHFLAAILISPVVNTHCLLLQNSKSTF